MVVPMFAPNIKPTACFKFIRPALTNPMTKTVVIGEGYFTPKENDIVDIDLGNEDFSILVAALQKAELVETLQGAGPFTVFAPSNAAFTAFEAENPGTLASLTAAQLTSVLSYHVVAGVNVLSNAIPAGPITTFETGTFTVTGTVITDEEARETNIVAVDVQASNGVIHVLDNVLLPNL